MSKREYSCVECGYKSAKWLGRCLACGAWDSFVSDENISPIPDNIVKDSISSNFDREKRYTSGVEEFDRVLGGGLVEGSVVLLSGEPGVGKSTLIMQLLNRYAKDYKVSYVSGEESSYQIKSRANRLGCKENINLIIGGNIDEILKNINGSQIVAIDSIQTMHSNALPGTVAQIREAISKIINVAKSKGISFLVVGHINKDGKVAGPKMLEHMVDTLLEFEGEKDFGYRIVRSNKNRFGSVNEIGLFSMDSSGMKEVKNPSKYFINEKSDSSGSVVTAILEGNRVFLIEVQALVSLTTFSVRRCISQGVDSATVQIMSAILDKFLNMNLSNKDLFVNIPGGIKIKDPSISLALVLAIYSSSKSKVMSLAAIGEVGLTGEVRRVSNIKRKVKELVRLGYKKIVVPHSNLDDLKEFKDHLVGIKNISDIAKDKN